MFLNFQQGFNGGHDMTRTFLFLFAALCFASFAVNGSASEDEHHGLRGDDDYRGERPAPGMDWQAGDSPIARTFEHQPPLIPHSIEEYEISAAKNDCLECHGEDDSGAPEPHASHYEDRDDHKGDKIAAQWYFCTQCHVGQVDAKPLVENTFQGK
jgi:cytochrome c-type protein NapB